MIILSFLFISPNHTCQTRKNFLVFYIFCLFCFVFFLFNLLASLFLYDTKYTLLNQFEELRNLDYRHQIFFIWQSITVCGRKAARFLVINRCLCVKDKTVWKIVWVERQVVLSLLQINKFAKMVHNAVRFYIRGNSFSTNWTAFAATNGMWHVS